MALQATGAEEPGAVRLTEAGVRCGTELTWRGRPESCEGQCSCSRQQNDNQNIKAQVKSEKEIEQNKPSTQLQLKPVEVERGNG